MAKGGPVAGASASATAKHRSATIQLDEDDFAKPLALENAANQMASRTASLPVKGAAKRVQKAADDAADLQTFSDEIERHLKQASFASLPRVARPGQPGRLHRLKVGEYAGVFLVSDDGLSVVGLSFARLPGDFTASISAMLGRVFNRGK